MKTLIISDITLENLARKQLIQSVHKYNFVFSEDLVSELSSLSQLDSYDVLVIYIDAFFKKYKDEYLDLLLESIFKLTCRTTKTVFCSNLIHTGWSKAALVESVGIFGDAMTDKQFFIEKLTRRTNFVFLDVQNLLTELGNNQCYNFKLGHMYQAPYTKFFLNELALYLDSLLSMYSTADKKVIVLDCDNTLWNGIVGEDGAEGISCDLNSKGILYFHFQQFLLSRKKMGFVLCLCSKNNEKDVREAFLKKRMPLKWDDFIVTKVNWENKDKNIKDIAEELNLGLDSFVFVDDSDFEVMHIERSLPEVKVFKMTGSYTNFMRLSSELVFKKKVITNEDKDKSEQYLQESKRKVLQRESSSFDDYIKTLEIKLKIDENPIKDLARISQLTEKTNQFNFNKIFYSIDDLRQKIESEQLICYSLRVSDKFGDYGLVGVILVGVAKDHLWLENYILSCRILGRRIEFDFLESVEMTVVERYGKKITKIIFKETPKNVPAQNFITQLNRCL